ncbi:hypothetical protein N657DRAFT_672102 [Parathielavia appendiculata]|uniref:Uncharacterized protein n=1 Tax=Parathielavia appendiculata TaxID=2587402 RepID=A0AAN6Z2M9_9PEZI|nr:hypothetical protein N657DRAFT_672102 [Parathielavia appendiculata]
MMTSLPFRPCQDDSQTPALEKSVPECSLLVCGLPTSMAVAHLRWEADPVPVKNWADGRLKTATLDVLDRSLTVFRYFRPHNSHAATVPPRRLHERLNLLNAKSGFLFVHDPSSTDIEESIQCMRRYMELQELHGGRGFWVVINTPRGALTRTGRDSIAAHFDDELRNYSELNDTLKNPSDFGRCVLQLPVVDACRVVGEAMLTSPQIYRPRVSGDSIKAPGERSDQEFWVAFRHGRLVPWKHKDYIRAAYLTLLRRENNDKGLLEVATNFAADMHNFKQRGSQFQLLPESRTLTVFWLYQVKLAMCAFRVYHDHLPDPISLKRVIHFFPELMDEKLPDTYYTSAMLKSPYSEKFWMLPNLRELVEPLSHEDPKFRERLTKKQPGDPNRLLRFAFAVVKRYLRPGETRRRSWFINLAFSSLQKYAMHLRSAEPLAAPFSETQSYFYIQLVHAALSQLLKAGKSGLVQEMSYALFKDTFGISPSTWTAYYSPKLWDSLEARGRFVPPDLKPLPDCIHTSKFRFASDLWAAELNEPFKKAGLIPELPSLEILHFHQSIILEDAKSLLPTLPPAEVTTHVHLLQYIHTHLIKPTHTTSPSSVTRASLLPLFRSHLSLLKTSSPLPKPHVINTLILALHYLSPPETENPDYNPPPATTRFNFKFRPSHTDPQTKKFIIFHNCPCHADLPIIPDDTRRCLAVYYPQQYPYDHPPQLKHGCDEGGQEVGGGEETGVGGKDDNGDVEGRDWDGKTFAGEEENGDDWEVVP